MLIIVFLLIAMKNENFHLCLSYVFKFAILNKQPERRTIHALYIRTAETMSATFPKISDTRII